MLKSLPDKLKTLILMGTKQAGSYAPADALLTVQEEMTQAEFETAEAFLQWVHADKKSRHFGHGNIDAIYSRFLKENGIIPIDPFEEKEEEERRRGQMIVDILGLRKVKDGSGPTPNYRTAWGTKTALGLYRTVKRIIEEGN